MKRFLAVALLAVLFFTCTLYAQFPGSTKPAQQEDDLIGKVVTVSMETGPARMLENARFTSIGGKQMLIGDSIDMEISDAVSYWPGGSVLCIPVDSIVMLELDMPADIGNRLSGHPDNAAIAAE